MEQILGLVSIAVGLGILVCFIMVVVKMFQNGKTSLGIVSIVTYCCLIGNIIALVVGWQNADRWRIRNLMITYSVLFAVGVLLNLITLPGQVAQFQEAMRQAQQQQGVPQPVPAPAP